MLNKILQWLKQCAYAHIDKNEKDVYMSKLYTVKYSSSKNYEERFEKKIQTVSQKQFENVK